MLWYDDRNRMDDRARPKICNKPLSGQSRIPPSREKEAFYEEGPLFGKGGLFRVREGAFAE